jgi:DnaJ-class molecular chaperone
MSEFLHEIKCVDCRGTGINGNTTCLTCEGAGCLILTDKEKAIYEAQRKRRGEIPYSGEMDCE